MELVPARSPEAIRVLPAAVAWRLMALPLAATPHRVRIAVCDPTDLRVLDDLRFACAREVELVELARPLLARELELAYGPAPVAPARPARGSSAPPPRGPAPVTRPPSIASFEQVERSSRRWVLIGAIVLALGTAAAPFVVRTINRYYAHQVQQRRRAEEEDRRRSHQRALEEQRELRRQRAAERR